MSARFTAMLFCVGFASVADAKPFTELFPHTKFQQPQAQEFVESLDYQQGTVKLDTGGIHLKVPSDFYFLGVNDARRVITEAWRNPPSTASGIRGVIFPAAKTPLDDTWGAVITFQEDGYVSDEDAANIDYTELLITMQESTAGANDERTKQGFPAIRIIGWASPPFYDKTSHKLHWAKELAVGDSLEHTLNYDVRALGRRGVLKINYDLAEARARESEIAVRPFRRAS